jgi:hypothetical protein
MNIVSFPSVKDRSTNEPMVLVHPDMLLSMYNWSNLNSENKCDITHEITEDVKNWAIKTGYGLGWISVGFSNNQLFLSTEKVTNYYLEIN